MTTENGEFGSGVSGAGLNVTGDGARSAGSGVDHLEVQGRGGGPEGAGRGGPTGGRTHGAVTYRRPREDGLVGA